VRQRLKNTKKGLRPVIYKHGSSSTPLCKLAKNLTTKTPTQIKPHTNSTWQTIIAPLPSKAEQIQDPPDIRSYDVYGRERSMNIRQFKKEQ
jgi:hypothetical protein